MMAGLTKCCFSGFCLPLSGFVLSPLRGHPDLHIVTIRAVLHVSFVANELKVSDLFKGE